MDCISLNDLGDVGNLKMAKEKEELKELKHDPMPGFRPLFYIVFSIGVLYLGTIAFLSLR